MTAPVVWVGLAAAGAAGAVARYLVDQAIMRRRRSHLPVGTITINVTGSLLLGLISGAALYHAFPTTPRVILGTGFCGAYTTFSTFAFETVRLLEEGEGRNAVLNLGVSLVGGLAAAAAGLAVMAAL